MEEDQIWAQLELKAANVCKTLEECFDGGQTDPRGMMLEDDEDEEGDAERLKDMIEDDSEDDEMDGLEGFNWAHDESAEIEEEDQESSEDEDSEDLGEETEELHDPSEEEDEEDYILDLDAVPERRNPRRVSRKRHAELDDGFFNLADFNAEIEEAESKDVSNGALGEGSDDEDSEEDVIDFFAPVTDGDRNEEDGMGIFGGTFYLSGNSLLI